MNKKGFTILELLISITLISVVLLLLLRVMMALEVINHDKTYASDDEIARVEIIGNIEQDFLDYHLNGLKIEHQDNKTILTFLMDQEKTIIIDNKSLTYDNEEFELKSSNATYGTCLTYNYQDLENGYYLLNIVIPVYIDGKNTTIKDDLELTYLGLKNEFSSYPNEYTC